MSMTLFEVKEKLGPRTVRLGKELTALRKSHEKLVPEVDLEGFGMSLRRLRMDADISGRDMAKRIGVSAAFLCDCELGRRKLSSPLCIMFIHYCQAE